MLYSLCCFASFYVEFIPFFVFHFLVKVTTNKKKSAVLFIYFLYKQFAIGLKMMVDFFGFWSLWPKNKKRKEPDIFFYFFAENVNCQLKIWKHTSWVLYQIRILLKFRCSEKASKVWRNLLLCFDVTEQGQNYEEDGDKFLWSSQNVTIITVCQSIVLYCHVRMYNWKVFMNKYGVSTMQN